MSASGPLVVLAIVILGAGACAEGTETVELVVPSGAALSEVADSLSVRGVIRAPSLFELYARLRGDDRRIKAGRYEFRTGSGWRIALGRLTRGEVQTVPITIPEGFQLPQIAERIAELTGRPLEAVSEFLNAPDLYVRLGVPGPGVEGYLFPDTYRFARGVAVEEVVEAMAAQYLSIWTPERRAQLDSLDLDEHELVTLASIVQAEARRVEEMPRIAGVYHNRLRLGWLLQADPTVLYALGGTRQRLLYAAIDSVADNPYNTYTQPGLPPGPIGAPGAAAIDAALSPVDDYLYFVATPDGTHVFTRSLAEHNRAKAEAQRARQTEAVGS